MRVSIAGAGRRVVHGLSRFEQALLPPARFTPRALEQAFLDDYARQYASRRRVSAALALVIWTSFAGFDIWRGGPALAGLLSLRLASSLVLASFIALSFRPAFLREGFAQGLVVGGAVAAYLPFLGLIMAVDSGGDPLIDGVAVMAYLAFISNFTFLRARALLVLLSFDLVTAAPALAVDVYASQRYPRSLRLADFGGVVGSMGDDVYLLAVTYMAIAVFVGYASATQRERAARLAFERERRLAQANLALDKSRREVEDRTAALLAAKEDLRALAERRNQEKSRFLADAAHDLSQPTHAVSLLIGAARHALARGDPDRSAVLLETAARAAQVTRASFGAVLEISQLELGLVRATYAAVDLEDLIDDVLAPLRAIAEERGVRLVVRRSRVAAVNVTTDAALLARVLSNLVSNAIKYSDPARERPTVLVGVVAIGDEVRVDVVDDGVGIPEEKLEEVFKPFVQLDNPTRDRDRGLGLGLSIVRATIDLLDGHRLTLDSRPGCGARARLYAPRRRSTAPSASLQGRGTGTLDFASLFVWCVEDDALAREALVALLGEMGILTEVSVALGDFERSLVGVERRPDLVISDYRLTGGDTALDVARAFARRWDDDIPLIVVTGEVAPVEIAGLSARTRLIRKPVAPEDFIEAIGQLCGAAAPAA